MAQKTFNDTKINVKFDEATSRQQLNSGENISTLFGKIKKIFSDLKAICFSGSYNDLSDTPTTATTDSDGLMSAEDKGKLDAFEITTTGGKLHDKDIATTDLIPTTLPANGGNADTVDGFHADDFAKAYNDYLGTYLEGKSGDIRELAHLLPTGGSSCNTYYPEFQNITFPISGDILITWNKSKFSRNGLIYGTLTIQSMTSTGDICICSVYNTTAYTDWQKIYTDWNKPYVTGIATNVVDGVIHSNTYYSYHGFMPSAVFYIVPGQMTNQHDMIYSAKSFDTEKFTAPSMTNDAGNTLTQIKYIMFK